MSDRPFLDENLVRAVEVDNLRRLIINTQLDRLRHFEGRLRDLGLSPAEYLIVILCVDDANGAALADALMPGHDWSAIRATGQVPFVRGLVSRPEIQAALIGPAASELGAIDGVAVLAMDRGIITAFAASELR